MPHAGRPRLAADASASGRLLRLLPVVLWLSAEAEPPLERERSSPEPSPPPQPSPPAAASAAAAAESGTRVRVSLQRSTASPACFWSRTSKFHAEGRSSGVCCVQCSPTSCSSLQSRLSARPPSERGGESSDARSRCRSSLCTISPKQYTSIALVAARPSLISGGRYFLVPTVRPTQSLGSWGTWQARPKSISIARFSPATRTFLALRSLCTIPSECSRTNARSTPARVRIGSIWRATRSLRRQCRAYSRTRCSRPPSANAPNAVTMFGCAPARRR
mmetsp:Transcript_26738/g.79783  ORF Transcript_26738/g.79783 Transcript_26738/m.79783 type:complete len:276 (-) Transcript_26738:262-1089(-)